MSVLRARWILVAVGAAGLGSMSACGGSPVEPVAEQVAVEPLAPVDPHAAQPDVVVQGPGAEAACYIESNGEWRPLEGEREAKCFERDNCSGGLRSGQPPGTCLKWATGPDQPALPWSRTLTDPVLAADVPPPKDIYAGSYEMTSDCHVKGCAYGSTRFAAATPLRAIADARSPVIATIPPGECVDTESDALMQTPQRGVVLENTDRFAAGDVIYLTSSEGEGFSTVWRRGEYLEHYWDEVVVRWEDEPDHPLAGYWMQVTRTNGQGGWVRDPERSETHCNPARP